MEILFSLRIEFRTVHSIVSRYTEWTVPASRNIPTFPPPRRKSGWPEPPHSRGF